MELPTPAKELWKQIRTPLREALNRRLGDFKGWKLSGGTILAAQWKHRRSTDIDLKIEPTAGIITLDPRYDPSFRTETLRLGAGEPSHAPDQVMIPFENGKINIFQAESTPNIGETEVEVEGSKEVVLANAQILTGKISGRGLDSPTRDLFDIAVAAEMDPEALETAVNTIQDATWSEIVARWEETRGFHQQQAKDTLLDVPNRWREIADDPAGAAIKQGQKARYDGVIVRWEDQKLLAITENVLRQKQRRVIKTETAADIENSLEETGLRSYLENRAATQIKKVIQRIEATTHTRAGIIYGTPVTPGTAAWQRMATKKMDTPVQGGNKLELREGAKQEQRREPGRGIIE